VTWFELATVNSSHDQLLYRPDRSGPATQLSYVSERDETLDL